MDSLSDSDQNKVRVNQATLNDYNQTNKQGRRKDVSKIMNNGFVIYPTNRKQLKYIKKERSIEDTSTNNRKYEFAPHTDNDQNMFNDEVMF